MMEYRPELSLLNAARYLNRTRSVAEWWDACIILNRLAMEVMLYPETS